MKREIPEAKFKKLLTDVRTTRKRVLSNAITSKSRAYGERKLKTLVRYLRRIKTSWILDSYSKDLIGRFIKVIREDLESL